MTSESKRIARTYYVINGLFIFGMSLIWGINTLFLLSAGLDLFKVFIVNGVFTLTTVLFEIPTGIVADTMGRRISFLTCTVVVFIGTLAYLWASYQPNALLHFVWTSVVISVGLTFQSGAIEAWAVDAMTHYGGASEIDQMFSRNAGLSSAGMLLGSIGGGLIGSINMDYAYVLRGSLILLSGVFAYFYMHDDGYEKKPLGDMHVVEAMNQTWRNSLQVIREQPVFKYFLVTAFIIGIFEMWGWYAWQPYFLELYGDPEAIWLAGFISAGVSLAMMTGSFIVPKLLTGFKRRSTFLLVMYSLMVILVLGVGFAPSFIGAVGAYILFRFAASTIMPVRQAYIHKIIPSSERATAISFDALVSSLGGVGGQPSLGYVARTFSVPFGYRVSSLIILSILPWILKIKKESHEADNL